ncbi:MAG: hypothetical protein JXB62_13845 [Pirellulales bacterium]|nr:hypothetical protein [Pirellulales bacterium]
MPSENRVSPRIARRSFLRRSAAIGAAWAAAPATFAAEAEDDGLLFDVDETGDPGDRAPRIAPWRHVALDPEYAGAWVVAGDVDGDGQAEIVSARNVDQNDVHYTSAVVAQRLDGSVVWRWGDPKIGRKKLHHDVACQIHDWDGDGRSEVVLCTKGFLVALDGASGRERRRVPLPDDATDCLTFADLSGQGRPTDVLVKTRYGQIWAFNRDGKLLWTVKNPGGFRTAHHPLPVDVDGDGRDEIMAGYTLLGPDGRIRWTYRAETFDAGRGHLDCCRVLRMADHPEDVRLVLTCCGANGLAVVNGLGKVLWEATGHHFESVDVGKICADVPGMQIAVDIDHQPWGRGPIWVFDENGRHLGRIMTNYARHHALVDWTGDGTQAIVVAEGRGVYDGHGRRIATFDMDETGATRSAEMLALVGDMTGDGRADVMLTTRSSSAVYIYRNERGRRPSTPVAQGTGLNFTLY